MNQAKMKLWEATSFKEGLICYATNIIYFTYDEYHEYLNWKLIETSKNGFDSFCSRERWYFINTDR